MKTLSLITAAIAGAAMMASPAVSRDDTNTKGEERLAKMLEGRVAGEPQSCIRDFPTSDLTVIDGTALVYKQGRTLYVNVTQDPRSIDEDDTLVTRRFSSRLCRTDIVTTIDRSFGAYTGNIFLGDFIPYRKES